MSEVIATKTLEYIQTQYMQGDYKINPTCYFYDLSIVQHNIKQLEQSMPKQVHLYYAMKANPNPNIMQCMQQNPFVRGVEIASCGELEHALRWYPNNTIIFTGPGKTDYELEQAVTSNIRFINVESIAEAVRVNAIAERLGRDVVDVLLRINLNYCVVDGAEQMSGCSTKMGIDEDAYVESFKFISNLEHIRIKGIHVFAACGVLNYQSLLKVDAYIFDLVRKTEKLTGSIDIIDFGGGLGIDYTDENQELDIIRYGVDLKILFHSTACRTRKSLWNLVPILSEMPGIIPQRLLTLKQSKERNTLSLPEA